MAQNSINLRDYPRAADGSILTGESGHHVTSREAQSDVTSRDAELAPEHVRVRIWKFIALSGRALTRAEIAKGLGYKKSGWLDRWIEGLVNDQWLEKSSYGRPQGLPVYKYTARRPASRQK